MAYRILIIATDFKKLSPCQRLVNQRHILFSQFLLLNINRIYHPSCPQHASAVPSALDEGAGGMGGWGWTQEGEHPPRAQASGPGARSFHLSLAHPHRHHHRHQHRHHLKTRPTFVQNHGARAAQTYRPLRESRPLFKVTGCREVSQRSILRLPAPPLALRRAHSPGKRQAGSSGI